MSSEYESVLRFWFEEIDEAAWWTKDAAFDKAISDRFGERHSQAACGELWQWRTEPRGRLAEIILLDQFSRNIFRDTTQAFAWDSVALVLAQEAVSVGADKLIEVRERSFLYLPYMHSESLSVHEQALVLFDQPGMESNLNFEKKHKVIIDRFGRYPHRNGILGRTSTPEELEFLQQPGSSF